MFMMLSKRSWRVVHILLVDRVGSERSEESAIATVAMTVC